MGQRFQATVKDRIGLNFNGSDETVTQSSYIIPQSFTIAFWYNPTRTTANDRVLDQQDAGPSGGVTILHPTTASPQLSYRIMNAGVQTVGISSTDMRFGIWQWVAATFTTNSAKFYVNNVQQGATDSSCVMSAPSAVFTLGKRAGSSANFANGFMQNFVVYNRVLNSSEMLNLYTGIDPTSIPNLDINYKFLELSGTVITDYSSNARTGTRAGSAVAWFTEPGRRRLVKAQRSIKALNFSNLSTGILTTVDNANLRPETNSVFTYTAWIYLFNTNNNVLPRLSQKNPHSWCFMGDQTNGRANQLALEIANPDSSTTEYWASTRLQPYRWYHVAVTFDGTSTGVAQHYVNGQLEAMTTLVGPYVSIKSTSGNNFVMGNSSSRNLPGFMSNFRVHNGILTQNEIQKIMLENNVTRLNVGKWDFSEGSGSTVADSSGNGYDGTITAATWVSVPDTRSSASGRSTASTRSSV